MKGKERDLKLANELREAFIKTYGGKKRAFEDLLEGLGENCTEKLIFRLKGERTINLYKDYVALKEVAAEVIEKEAQAVYEIVCEQDEARAWINDNGKYSDLAYEALYEVFKQSEKLTAFCS